MPRTSSTRSLTTPFAVIPAPPSNSDVRFEVKHEGEADEPEPGPRHEPGQHGGGREQYKCHPRAVASHSPLLVGDLVAFAQDASFEHVVGAVSADEQCCIHDDRGGGESGLCDPGGGERQQGHEEQMHKVDPDDRQGGGSRQPRQVVVVDPDDGDEDVADQIAHCRLPQLDQGGEAGRVGRAQLQDHDRDDHGEYGVGIGRQPVGVTRLLLHGRHRYMSRTTGPAGWQLHSSTSPAGGGTGGSLT